MPKATKYRLDFEIDKLTRSIENAVTGESFSTEILPASKKDLLLLTKSNGWLFNWKNEFADPEKKVYKLVTVENMNIIQGLVSLTVAPDHVFMNLIENAPFNRSRNKIYHGVAGNLVAHACRVSLASGGNGFVSFLSKTKLIPHYTASLGARHEGGQLMVIYPSEAMVLIERYFSR